MTLPYSVYFRHDDGTWTLYSREPSATDARDVAMMLSRLNYPVQLMETMTSTTMN